MLDMKIVVLNFSDTQEIKNYTGSYVTLSGVFREVVYLDRNGDVIHFSDENNHGEISGVWFNSYFGMQNNDKFGILLLGDAITELFNTYGMLTNSTIQNYLATCNDVLLESMQGTEKPYVRISNKDEFNNLILIRIV